MTTFQDPPPQSRRAVRQSERGETPSQAPASSLPYSFDPGAEPVDQAAPTRDAPQISGRRVQLPQAALVQEHLTTVPSANQPPTSEQPVYRVRDFSPEGRRAAISREQFAGVSQGL